MKHDGSRQCVAPTRRRKLCRGGVLPGTPAPLCRIHAWLTTEWRARPWTIEHTKAMHEREEREAKP